MLKKQILLIFVVMFGFLTSCERSLESMAKDQLKSTMKEVLKNPENATLTNVKTVYNSDSVCIIDFIPACLNSSSDTRTCDKYFIRQSDENIITKNKK